jgi:hypothetical protein
MTIVVTVAVDADGNYVNIGPDDEEIRNVLGTDEMIGTTLPSPWSEKKKKNFDCCSNILLNYDVTHTENSTTP